MAAMAATEEEPQGPHALTGAAAAEEEAGARERLMFRPSDSRAEHLRSRPEPTGLLPQLDHVQRMLSDHLRCAAQSAGDGRPRGAHAVAVLHEAYMYRHEQAADEHPAHRDER
jgi:hypothetical protein